MKLIICDCTVRVFYHHHVRESRLVIILSQDHFATFLLQ